MRKPILAILAVTLLSSTPAVAARNHPIRGSNELSGGIGFSADFTRYTPGGFKWFNEYGLELSKLVWLNLQLNVSTGGYGGRCFYDNRGHWRCDDRWAYWGGTALEFAGGVKLKWRTQRVPLQIHAKFGGALDLIWFGSFYGAAVCFRGGAGVRYFVVPTLGIGAELVTNMGPAFLGYNIGVEFYGALDANFGVEWRF